MCPLFFKIYVIDMKRGSVVKSNMIQYADQASIFSNEKNFLIQYYILKKNIAKLILFFMKKLFIVNESRTNFILEPLKGTQLTNWLLKDAHVLKKAFVKYLGAYIGYNLSFHGKQKARVLHQKSISGKKFLFYLMILS